MLLGGGAAARARTLAGLTPLRIAAAEGHAAVAKLLEEHVARSCSARRGASGPGEGCGGGRKKEGGRAGHGGSGSDAEKETTRTAAGATGEYARPGGTGGPGAAGVGAAIADRPSMLAFRARADPWPWTSAGKGITPLVGMVNVSFQHPHTGEMAHEAQPLHALPVLSLLDARAALPVHVDAASINTSPQLCKAARRLRLDVERLRRELCTMQSIGSTKFWSMQFPLLTLAQRVRGSEVSRPGSPGTDPLHVPLLTELLGAFDAFLDELKPRIAPALGCDAKELHCPDFGGYQRIEPDHFLGRVHRDFPGNDETVFMQKHGFTRDKWWNVWALVSERPWGEPLVMFDPAPVTHRRCVAACHSADRADRADRAARVYAASGRVASRVVAWRGAAAAAACLAGGLWPWRCTALSRARARMSSALVPAALARGRWCGGKALAATPGQTTVLTHVHCLSTTRCHMVLRGVTWQARVHLAHGAQGLGTARRHLAIPFAPCCAGNGDALAKRAC